MDGEARHVFVYGTLLRGGPNHARFCGDALSIEPAWTAGRLYRLPTGLPVMIDAADGTVYGEAMTFSDLGATLAKLDMLEGYSPPRPERSLYLRVVRQVTLLSTGEPVPAWVYVWQRPLPRGAVFIPSGRWACGVAP